MATASSVSAWFRPLAIAGLMRLAGALASPLGAIASIGAEDGSPKSALLSSECCPPMSPPMMIVTPGGPLPPAGQHKAPRCLHALCPIGGPQALMHAFHSTLEHPIGATDRRMAAGLLMRPCPIAASTVREVHLPGNLPAKTRAGSAGPHCTMPVQTASTAHQAWEAAFALARRRARPG